MRRGQRFIVTTGEYSDYGIRDSFVVLKDFSFDLALAAWFGQRKSDEEYGRFGYDSNDSEQAFLEWLRSQGYVADEPLNKVHLCDYGRAEATPANDAADEPTPIESGDGE